MHDRKDVRAPIIVALDLHVIVEQPSYAAVALKRRRHACRIQRIDRAIPQHRRKGIRRANPLDPDVRRQSEIQLFGTTGLFLAARAIRHCVDRHAIFVGEDPTNPHRRRHLVFGIAHAFADQVLRFANAACRIDIDARVAEES